MSELYIGLMSGTSIDGVDAGLVAFDKKKIELIAFEYLPYPGSIRKKIQYLSKTESGISLKDYGALDALLGSLFAKVSKNLLIKANIPGSAVTAIGSHGQTIHHAPPAFSLQIGDPNIIAEETGITTVADFRRRDIAAGGQGAPLVPGFHRAFFSKSFDFSRQNICIVNIGGIANITSLSSHKTIGFDTGPGNTLMDYWIQKCLNKPYDKKGAWANSGSIIPELVNIFNQDPYFKLNPPKSTGKEYFSPTWLKNKITRFVDFRPEDIQASLCQLTADSISTAIHQYAPHTKHTLICGGGIHNKYLIELIRKSLNHTLSSTAKFGIDPDHVEAMAFAWLARQTIHNLPGNLTKVTGATTPALLGGIYSGKNGLG